MATLWTRSPGGFTPREVHTATGASQSEDCRMRIMTFRDGTRPSYALIAARDASVRVNGSVVVGGLRVLQHQDEIVVGEQQAFFSAESTPVIQAFQHAGPGRRPRCPVCRAEIQDGQSVVHCPGCSRLYHQIDATSGAPAKPCWTYSPACRFCEHPTSMSGEPAWRPDEEDL